MSLNVNTWHHRGGMSGSANLAYTIDPVTGEQVPLVWGTDEFGNPTLVTPDNQAPWYGTLLQSGINTAGSVFGGRTYGLPNQQPSGGGVGVTATATPTGIGAGLNLSTNTIILIGLIGAVFLFGKGRR